VEFAYQSFGWYWLELANRGLCDSLGSAEFNRVWGLWLLLKSKPDPVCFILDNANKPATAANAQPVKK
jgi:hypothetical protein